jgi:hypothetical protein
LLDGQVEITHEHKLMARLPHPVSAGLAWALQLVAIHRNVIVAAGEANANEDSRNA